MTAGSVLNHSSFTNLLSDEKSAVRRLFKDVADPTRLVGNETAQLFKNPISRYFDPDYVLCELDDAQTRNLEPNTLYITSKTAKSITFKVVDERGKVRDCTLQKSQLTRFRGSFDNLNDLKKNKKYLLQATEKYGLTYSETYAIFKRRKDLVDLAATYTNRLDSIDPVSFCYLSESAKKDTKEDLLFAFYVFCAQYHLDETERRHRTLKGLQDKLFQTALLMNALEHSSQSALNTHAVYVAQSKKPCKWLFVHLGKFIADKAGELSEGRTTTLNQWMGDINERRLYWIWGGGLLATVFSMLPEQLTQKSWAEQALHTPDDALGYFSWMLYYTRFGMHLELLLKHTLAGPWMSQRERLRIPALERFQTQWEQRRFVLLNDSIWATVNLATFFWLNGSGMLGYYGNVLTAGLLLVDMALSCWRAWADYSEYNRVQARITKDIHHVIRLTEEAQKANETLVAQLEEQDKWKPFFASLDQLNIEEDERNTLILNELERLKNQTKTQSADQPLHDQYKAQCTIMQEYQSLKRRLADLETHQQTHHSNWTLKKHHIAIGMAYSVALIIAFTIACSMLFPPAAIAPATAMALGLAGAALCFALTLAFSLASGTIDITHLNRQKKGLQTTYNAKIDDFKTLKSELSTLQQALEKAETPEEKTRLQTWARLKENEMRLLYLDIKNLEAKSLYQAKMVTLQKAKLIRSIFIDAMIPPMIFVSLMFLPMGVGLGTLAAGFALVVASKLLLASVERRLNALYKPNSPAERLQNNVVGSVKEDRNHKVDAKMPALTKHLQFDETAYQQFTQTVNSLPQKKAASWCGLFYKSRQKEPAIDSGFINNPPLS